MKKNFLVTEADSGLGLEFARQLAEMGHTVFAAVKKPAEAPALKRLCKKHTDRMCVLPLDASSDRSVAALAEELHFVAIDVLINNHATAPRPPCSIEKIDEHKLLHSVDVKGIGFLRLLKHLLPVLKAADNAVIVNVAGRKGDGDSESGDLDLRISDAALATAVRMTAEELKSEGITSVVLSAEPEKTESRGKETSSNAEESARALIDIILNLSIRDAGRVMDSMGRDISFC
jgi:NAD(P)-dependent dehydrogenase (short-subunit alcohol dehydrogenase family)